MLTAKRIPPDRECEHVMPPFSAQLTGRISYVEVYGNRNHLASKILKFL